MTRQVPDGLAHVLRAGGTVEPDHIHSQRFERGERTGDVRSEQHAPAGVQRHLHLKGDAAPEKIERSLDPGDRRLYLENVLRGLDQKHIDAAGDEGERLLVKILRQLVEGDRRKRRIAARRQHARRTHRSCDEARLLRRRVSLACLTRDSGGVEVDRLDLVAQPPFGESPRCTLEGACFHNVAPDREKALVDFTNHIRPRQHEVVVASLQGRAAKVLGRERVSLNARAHCPVVDEHSPRERVEVRRGGGRAIWRGRHIKKSPACARALDRRFSRMFYVAASSPKSPRNRL